MAKSERAMVADMVAGRIVGTGNNELEAFRDFIREQGQSFILVSNMVRGLLNRRRAVLEYVRDINAALRVTAFDFDGGPDDELQAELFARYSRKLWAKAVQA